jgi:hypothetical protein
VLANIGPDGKEAQGAAPGVVVASPSRENPDCRFPRLLCCHVLIIQIGIRGRVTLR